MGLSFQWIGPEQADRIVRTRMLCYGAGTDMLEQYAQRFQADPRGQAGDWLIAERDGVDVGTTTSLSLNMWVRGASVPCQGVAWVGTIKTHRRGGRAGERGIASQLMDHTIKLARDREQVVSALMPFRASYYEHFGYGLVERRCEWTVPLAVLPTGDFSGIRFMKDGDLPGIRACRQRSVERGQCDIERSDAGWVLAMKQATHGFVVVDQPTPGGAIQSWMVFTESSVDGKTRINVQAAASDSREAFLRQLHFLASLRDQYSAIVWQLPADLPLNWLLRETQLPHRLVEHPVARVNTITRMQVRILDHARFLGSLKLAPGARGKAVIAVGECEGTTSTFAIELEAGRITAKRTAQEPNVTCADKIWAAIACGELSTSVAARLGLVQCTDPSALMVLDELARGPLPFCNEYF